MSRISDTLDFPSNFKKSFLLQLQKPVIEKPSTTLGELENSGLLCQRVPEDPVVSREHLPQLEKIQEVLPSRRDEAHFR